MNAPHPRPRRSIVVDEVVIVVLLIGAAILGFGAWLLGHGQMVIVSIAALWVAFVFFAIFAYDFVADLRGWPPLQPFEGGPLPLAVREWLPLACLVAGLLVGHFFW